MSRVLLLITVCISLSGCVGPAHTAQVRGAYDLECDASQVSAYRVVGGTYVASGCGHWTEYACNRGGLTCVRSGPVYREPISSR